MHMTLVLPSICPCLAPAWHLSSTTMYAELLSLPLSVLGKVLSAVGSAQLLMSQKFQQFRGLCEQNLVSRTPPPGLPASPWLPCPGIPL